MPYVKVSMLSCLYDLDHNTALWRDFITLLEVWRTYLSSAFIRIFFESIFSINGNKGIFVYLAFSAYLILQFDEILQRWFQQEICSHSTELCNLVDYSICHHECSHSGRVQFPFAQAISHISESGKSGWDQVIETSLSPNERRRPRCHGTITRNLIRSSRGQYDSTI